ncbi:MAG: penicillin-binding transpeptidase domain-containing protein [Candidatus Promineifilaceae bacterium]|jgi:peptidoglycan glycosyltransferase
MKEMPPITPDRDKVLNLSKVLLSAFILVGISLVFWGVVRAGTLLARDDNPRGLEAERRLLRGSILDQNGLELALNEGPPNAQRRFYPTAAGGHVVGYYSIKHGTSGAEAGFDTILRGETDNFWADWFRQTMHLPQKGRDVQLALDYTIQETAVAALGENLGGALLLEIPRDGKDSAYVRAMASLPGFDPNQLDETFEELGAAEDAPLLNRVAKGQYQPGMLLQPLILASSIDQGLLTLNETVEDPDRPVQVNGSELRCAAQPPDPATWADVLVYRCPAPMVDLAERAGTGSLDAAFSSFGLYSDPVLEIDTETTPDQAIADPMLAGIGQEKLSITPLQVGLAMAALAGDGSLPQAQIGAAVKDVFGEWQPWHMDEILNAQAAGVATARAVRNALPQENGIYEFSPVVLSGPEGLQNAWYVGILPGEQADYVAMVVLENSGSEEAALAAGRSLLEKVQ